ncbi:hypothetical protein HOM50_04785 [bacterium]|jgi:hypothetical protein|nr:hypothetical protein [bacterium]MBT5015696.1 hypothetical protein [bacterium]
MKSKAVTAITLCFLQLTFGDSAISYQISGGRLGDQLISYCIAKEISLKYDIPLLYKPFKYSDQLQLSLLDKSFSSNFDHYTTVEIGHDLPKEIKKKKKKATHILYEVAFQHWRASTPDKAWYGVCSDQSFRQELRKYIAPCSDISVVKPPKGVISVAMHVRTGDGYDPGSLVDSYYEKFPKDDFFIDQILRLNEIFRGNSLYIYIFTDSLNTGVIKAKFQSVFSDYPSIVFNCKDGDNGWDNNVLEDLFSMPYFDCLIRPKSGYSVIAQAIGNYKVVLYPGGEINNLTTSN